MSVKELDNITKISDEAENKNEDVNKNKEGYSMPNEGCCSPEFSEGCKTGND